MAYSNVPIGTSNPGCIVILIDQSWSMDGNWQTGTKAEVAALAVNRILEELVLACRVGELIRDRCHVAVIGYGGQIDSVFDGMVSELPSALVELKKVKKSIPDGAGGIVQVDVEMPIWLQPKAQNGTPMHTAFERAADIVRQWCVSGPDGFPPIVINVTDGAANYPELTENAVREIMNLHTRDGEVLVFNLHIADSGYKAAFPDSTTQFPGDSLAEFLFNLSSLLPPPLFRAAEEAEFSLKPGARCFGYNLDEATMIRLLNFGSLGVTQVRALPEFPD